MRRSPAPGGREHGRAPLPWGLAYHDCPAGTRRSAANRYLSGLPGLDALEVVTSSSTSTSISTVRNAPSVSR